MSTVISSNTVPHPAGGLKVGIIISHFANNLHSCTMVQEGMFRIYSSTLETNKEATLWCGGPEAVTQRKLLIPVHVRVQNSMSGKFWSNSDTFTSKTPNSFQLTHWRPKHFTVSSNFLYIKIVNNPQDLVTLWLPWKVVLSVQRKSCPIAQGYNWKSQETQNFRGRLEWLWTSTSTNMKKRGGKEQTLSKILACNSLSMQCSCDVENWDKARMP